MSTHNTPADIEAQRQTTQAAHESQEFEQSDAAKVAAVAALADAQAANDGPKVYGHQQVAYMIRKALADPDAALARVRAEARAEAEAESERLRAIVADYEHRITWDTTCGNCANMLDRCYAETCRAETAEARLAAASSCVVCGYDGPDPRRTYDGRWYCFDHWPEHTGSAVTLDV